MSENIVLVIVIVSIYLYFVLRGKHKCPKCKKRFKELKKDYSKGKVWNEGMRHDGSYEKAYSEEVYVCPFCGNVLKKHRRTL